MNKLHSLAMFAICLAAVSGCGQPTKPVGKTADEKGVAKDKDKDRAKEERIAEALAKLSPEDRQLAESQKFCAQANKSRLGSMGPPVKIEIDGQPVFLCCKGCEDEAKKNGPETLAKVETLKAANK